MKLKQLESIEEVSNARSSIGSSDSQSSWGVAQGMVTIGVLLTLFAAGWLIYVMQGKPPAPKEVLSNERIEKGVESMNLLETFRIWSVLRQDIRQKMSIDHQYSALMKEYNIRLGVAIILVVAGLCLTLATILFARRVASRAGTS